jgi:hypothetical protein
VISPGKRLMGRVNNGKAMPIIIKRKIQPKDSFFMVQRMLL